LTYVVDTNILLYHLAGRLADPLPTGRIYASFITEIELLSFPRLEIAEEESIRQMLNSLEIVGIHESIKAEAIRIRRSYRFKLADSVVVATASILQAELLTNDAQLIGVPGIRVSSMPTI